VTYTATASESDQARAKLEEMLIVDTDVHVHETPAALARYCDMPWRVALENIADTRETYLDIPGFSVGGDSTLTAKFPSGHEATRMVFTHDEMRQALDELHVNVGILFPDHLLKLPMLPQPEYAAALARAYNAWMVEEWTSRGQGLLGCIVACPQDPADSVREIERYADDPGIVGIYLPCAGLEPLWGHQKYRPLFAAAEAADLPVVLHSVTVVSPVYPFNNHGYQTELGRHATSHTFSVIANLVDMVTMGVMVRYPRLRIAVTEAGISWMPFLMNRLDKEYLERRREVPYLTERPSHYLREVFVATQPIEEPERLSDIVTLVELYRGENRTMFASDWPHHDFDHPAKLNQVPFPDEVKRKIFGTNALELFKIDRDGRRLVNREADRARP
jgi:predicted TIM-barrel fold metal-dependent hydrolase